MQDSLLSAKEEIRRLREVEEIAKSSTALHQQRIQQSEETALKLAAVDSQLQLARRDNDRLAMELQEAKALARAGQDRALAEATACALMRSREEKAMSELTTARRQVSFEADENVVERRRIRAFFFCCCN